MAAYAVRASTSALRDEQDVVREWALTVSLPSSADRYAPRPLLTLTVGSATKRYSTEEVDVP